VRLKAQIIRELDRLEVLLEQLKTVEAERDALLKPASDEAPSPAAMLVRLKGLGPETAAVLWSEGLFRQFDNRRQWPPTPVWRRPHGRAARSPA
jgi:transposase